MSLFTIFAKYFRILLLITGYICDLPAVGLVQVLSFRNVDAILFKPLANRATVLIR